MPGGAGSDVPRGFSRTFDPIQLVSDKVSRAEMVHLTRPRIRTADDPIAALLLWTLIFAALALVALRIGTHDEAYIDDGAKAIGGVLLLLTAYFTARNLRQNADSAFEERLMRGAELLASSNPIEQTAGRRVLERLKARPRLAKADGAAIEAVLDAARPADGSD